MLCVDRMADEEPRAATVIKYIKLLWTASGKNQKLVSVWHHITGLNECNPSVPYLLFLTRE
jgi:hypothetical protein